MDPPSYTLTRSHTPRTLPHINVLPPTLTGHHAPPTVTHTRSHPSSSHPPFHTCPVIHASSKHILLTHGLCIIIQTHDILKQAESPPTPHHSHCLSTEHTLCPSNTTNIRGLTGTPNTNTGNSHKCHYTDPTHYINLPQ